MRKPCRRGYRLSIFLTALLSAAAPVFAQSVPSDTQAQRHLMIATADNAPISTARLLYYALLEFRYGVDYITAIAGEGYIQANAGTCDGVISGYPDLHRVHTNLVQVPIALGSSHLRVFAREGSNMRINSWNELDGLQVGILEHHPYISEKLPGNVTITARGTNRAVLNGLVNAEYDVAILAESEHGALGEMPEVACVGQVDQLTEYLYLNKKNAALVPRLSAALENMFNNGNADRLLNYLPLPEANQKRTIVHIISTSIELAREDQFSAELRKRFADDISLEWLTVNVDFRRFTRSPQNMAYIASLLRADCVPRNIAAVIVSGNTALEFLKDYYDLYFRNAPVLFYGVCPRYREIIQGNEKHFTGIVKCSEAYQTVEAALALFPGTENIYIVNDYTAEGIQYKQAFETDLKPLEGRFNIVYNENISLEALLAKIQALSKNSLVFFGSYFVDAEHQYYSLGQMQRRMERYCSVPILALYSTEPTYNAIGGKCLDYQRYGEEIAGMLQKLLDGGKAEDIPVVHDSTAYNRWVFDQNQMDRFHIKAAALPAGATITNARLPIWKSNPQFFIAILILSIVSLLLICGAGIFIFVNHKHNRQKDRLQQDLIREKETAQSASRAKSNFLANMSHEMRTPLTTVLGLIELAFEAAQLDDDTYANLVKVYRASETLLNLINDILDISKIEADKLELNPREYDLPSLLNDTITQSVLYIGEKPINLVLDIKEDLPTWLLGDELRIKQIFNNLLSNAFKFTKEGTVEFGVRCERDGDTVWLTAWVRDTGSGIRPEDLDKLFSIYVKMKEESNQRGATRRVEGTGLGLSISKKIAEMMDGSITVESEYGKGSVFTVRLRQKFVNESTIGTKVMQSLKNLDYSLQNFENTNMTRINMSYARVLVVDDNPAILDVVKGLIGLYGIKIDCVTSGQQAIDVIREEKVRYHAIFMDYMMPKMNGIEAARIIRQEINTAYAQTIPIIALTANAVAGNEEMFLSQGFQEFVSKPIDLARLDAVLRQWVRDKKEESLLPKQLIGIKSDRVSKRVKHMRAYLQNIPELDVTKGIARFGFSEDTYFKMLQSYITNTRPLLDGIKETSIDDLNTYAITIHGIKGSSSGIAAEKVADAAEALEKAALAKDYDFVRANNQDFIALLIKLMADIEKALVKSGWDRKQSKNEPDKALLIKLCYACENFDIDTIDAVMADLESYEYASDNGLIAWLRENIDQGKYISIKENLSARLYTGVR